MFVSILILSSVRRNRACATVDIYTNHSIILSEREREREREREGGGVFSHNFPVFIFKYDGIVRRNSASIQVVYMWKY